MAQNPFLSSFDQQDETTSADRYALPGIKQEQPGAKSSASDNYLPPADVRPIFETAAKEFNVPVNVLMALGHQESRYNPSAVGVQTQWGRAKGMMQYLDSTAKGMGINPFDPAEAIPAAAKQIRERLDKGYSMEDAVKEHFAGPDRKLWGEKTNAYGREVMEKVGRIGDMLGMPSTTPAAARGVIDTLNDEEPGRYRAPTAEELDAFEKSQTTTKPTQAEADSKGFLDRAGDAASGGMKNVIQSLSTAKFALAGGDSGELAKNLAAKFAEEQGKTKTTGEQEIDKAFQDVTDAKGVWETTKAGAKAIGTAITNPKDLAIGVIEQAPNMLPTLGAGAVGAAGGAGIGAVGGIPGAIGGAIWGGRAGMVAGTTATELGAEVEQMVLERLTANKQAPTEQNIKNLLDDKTFQSEAQERGLKKGLTVAVVDQIFMGLGGKVVGKAVNAPTKAGKIGYGAGAVGLDAVGETTGEAASQLVARGEVDKGDALREGVYGLGQSIVEPTIGATMQAGKRAANAMRPTPAEQAQAVAAENNIPNIVITGTESGEQVATATPAQPSQAAGPLSRAVENAADQPARVTVTAPEGEITGFLQSTTQDSKGNTVTRVLGDDGQVYNFTSADNVQIKPEAGPLTSSVEKAAAQTPALAQESAPTEQTPARAKFDPQGLTPGTPEYEAAFQKWNDEQQENRIAESNQRQREENRSAIVKKNSWRARVREWFIGSKDGDTITDKGTGQTYRVIVKTRKDGTVTKTLVAVDESGNPLPEGRSATGIGMVGERVDGLQDTILDEDTGSSAPETTAQQLATSLGKLLEDGEATTSKTKQNGASEKPAEAIDVSGRTDQQLTYLAQNGQPGWREAAQAELAKRSAEPAKAPEPTLETMTEPQLRERLKYIANQAKTAGGWNKMLMAERKKVEAQINKFAKAIKQETTTNEQRNAADLPVRDERGAGASLAAETQGNQQIAGAGDAQAVGAGATAAGTAVAGNAADVSGADRAADAKPALESLQDAYVAGLAAGERGFGKKQAPADLSPEARAQYNKGIEDAYALAEREKQNKAKKATKEDLDHLFGKDKDEHAGKWFGSREKADAYVAKKSIAGTHEVVQTGKVRFEVKPKSEAPATSERQTKIDTVLNNGGKVVDGELRQQNGLGILKLTDAELAAIPDDKKDTSEAVKARLNAVYGNNQQEQTNGDQAAQTVKTQAQEPQAPDTGAREGVKREFTYAVKPTEGGFLIESDNGGGVVMSGRPNGPGVMNTVPPRVFKTEAAAREYMQKKGMTEAQAEAKPVAPKAGDILFDKYGTDYRIESERIGEVTLTKNRDKLSERKVRMSSQDFARLLREDKEYRSGQNDELDAEMRSYERKAEKPTADNKPAKGKKLPDQKQMLRDAQNWWESASTADRRALLGANFKQPVVDANAPLAWEKMGDGMQERIAEIIDAKNASPASKLEVRLTEAQNNLLELRQKQAEAVESGNAWAYDKKIADAEQAVNAYIKARDKKAEPEAKPLAEAIQKQFAENKIFTADKVEAARARLRSKLNQLNSGIDPEVLVDGMTIAGAYIESGVRKFADYAKAMTDDFGDTIKPYLLSFYEAARNYPGVDKTGMSTVDEAKAAHDEILSGVPVKAAEELKDTLGTVAKKPAKLRKTGSKSDVKLTQDWGVSHIDGYGDAERETGNSTKDAFIKDAKAYLNAVAGILTEQGYMPHNDRRGKAMKPVSANEGGMAGSGDVILTMHRPDGGGIYVTIGDSSLRGAVPTTKSGIAIMFRAADQENPYGVRSMNRWAPVDLSAADLAILLDKEAKPATKIEKAPAAAILSNEGTRNDTEPTQDNAGTGAQGSQSEFVLQAESGEPAGRSAATDSRSADGNARGRAQPGNRGGDNAGQAQLRGRSDAADANAEQPVSGSRGSGAATGARGTGRPRSGVGNYRIAQGELTREGSWKTTAERNVEIVELVKQITSENRQATPEERAKLVKFTGWGASEIANGVFPDRYGRYKDASWQALGERLKAAMTEEEYAQAKRTTQYAHYTSESVIRSIYDGLGRLGFNGGAVVEPGMGTGHFIGLMPDGMAANTQYTGIEYDTFTGNIAKLLYPGSNVIVGDYTRTNLPKDFFDAAIGNPPFSSTQILSDPEYKSRRPMLHDYFFMKTIDRVKPGGVLVFVTSKGTMDKTSDKSRKYLAERANLLGAIRLPQTAFKDNAGTEVVTDIIFLQKRGEGIADNGVNWLGVKEVDTPDGKATINEYFADNPAMVLGKHALQGSMYRANEYTVLPPDGDIEKLFAYAIGKLPENVYRPQTGSKAAVAAVQDRDFNPKSKKEGGLYLADNGKLMQVENGSGVEVEFRTNADGKQIALTPKQKKWLRDYVSLRDALKQAQYDQLNDGDWQKSLKALNKAYDSFVKENGQILEYSTIERTNKETGETTETKRYKNEPLLRLDVEGALAYALESVKEDGTIIKGAVLSERVLQRPQEPEIKTTQDALFVSLNRNGGLNLDDVVALAGTDKESVIADLGTSIYDAPGTGWQLADEYLSGNVVRKLKEAQAAAEINQGYKRNVEALLAVQPRPLGPTDITVRLGANWVPASDVAKFADEVLGDRMDIKYNPLLNKWDVEQMSRSVSEWGFDKAQSGAILDSILNNRQIKITWRDSEGKTHVDLESTEKANDIAAKMRDRFRSWVWTDPKRAERLVNYYNENFNNIAPRQFDGSHLTLPGVSARFKLYPHQKRAVWRIVQQGDTYLAHAVGAGKTMEMIAGGMEERRLGLINKPMYVVPNHMLAQFSREFLELYPTANIMVADEHNFHSSNRKRFVAQAALNNPDAIVITHSAFGRIGMSDAYYQEFINKQIDDWKEALDDVDKGDRITRKQIERRIEQLEQRLEGRQSKDKKDQVLTFEELGVDKLYVDEFHEFRKLDFATNQGNVKGIDPNGSQRALDLYMKVEYLRGKNPGRALVAASGTPVTNTMGELYTAQRFFQPDQLQEDGLASFDAWANQYGDIVTGFEQNAAGGYEMVARFAKFQNVPELMRRVRSFMDILTSSNLGELVKRPDVIGGGREVEVTPVPEGYKEYQQQLQNRIKAIKNRKGPPKKGEDIILNVIGDGRFSAIDMRFVNPDAPSDPNSKLNTAITRMIDAYNETKDYEYAGKDGKVEPIKGSSIILFTDIGLGEQSAASRGFDMRGWIEKRLTDAGIPRDQIAFMRDHKQHAKKERLFADMREGKKRILIGGKEMETGTNVQKRLTHLFHLDAPWFPASVEQREGRIVRQGNQNKEVKITALATKGSYDSTMWGMNARKARFIEQAMNGDESVRSLDDVSEASAFEMAAALASGDERYLKLAGLKADVERLERLRQAHYDDQNKLTRDKHWAEESVKRNTNRSKEIQDAIAKRQPIRAGEFAGKVGGKTYDSREEFGQAIFKQFQTLAGDSTMGEQQLGEIGGFPIKFYGIKMQGSGGYAAALHVEIPDSDALLTFPLDADVAVGGIATRAANQVNGLDRQLAETKQTVEQSKARIEQITKRLGSTFPEESLLLEKVAELNALETELAAENDAANAEAAAATQEIEGDKPAEDEGAKFSVAALRDETELEAIFADLEKRGLARNRAERMLTSDPDKAIIQYIHQNFFDILEELDDSKKVTIKC